MKPVTKLKLRTDHFKVDREFLTPVSQYEKFFKNTSVIYVRTDNLLPPGYYRIINIRDTSIDLATEFGLCTVNKDCCFFTQEIIMAFKTGMPIIFKDVKANTQEDTAWEEEQRARNDPFSQINL